MTAELTVLTLPALLQMVQLTLYSVTARKQVGNRYALSPRDEPRLITGTVGRLQRAMTNHFEALTLFTIACTVVTLSNQSTQFTATCAWTYLAARVLYVPAYACGLSPWRSLIWFIGLIATLLMLGAALF